MVFFFVLDSRRFVHWFFFSSFQQFQNVHFVQSPEYSNTFLAVEANFIAFLPPSTRTEPIWSTIVHVCVRREYKQSGSFRLWRKGEKKTDRSHQIMASRNECMQSCEGAGNAITLHVLAMHSWKWWAAQPNSHTHTITHFMFFEWMSFRVRIVVNYISLVCPFSSTPKKRIARRWQPDRIECRVWKTHLIN